MIKRALLLAGGASRRMGQNKALIEIDGKPMGVRIAEELRDEGWLVTVLGGQPLDGFEFLADCSPNSGPLNALRHALVEADKIFVASCDLPLFRGWAATTLANQLGEFEAVIPNISGRLQPLCATYHGRALTILRERPELTRVMDWISALKILEVDEKQLTRWGISPHWFRGVNTAKELESLLVQADESP